MVKNRGVMPEATTQNGSAELSPGNDQQTLPENVFEPDENGDLYLIGVGASVIRQFSRILTNEDYGPDLSTADIRLYGTEETLKEATDDTLTAIHLQSGIADGRLTIKYLSPAEIEETVGSLPALILAGSRIAAPTGVGRSHGHMGVIQEEDDEKASHLRDAHLDLFEDAPSFTDSLRAPSFSDLDTAARDRLDSEVAEDYINDFRAALNMFETLGTKDDPMDTVTLAIILGAKHGVLLYNLGYFGEDSGLASRATISREKNELSEMGVITTEKVPVDVGRPRLRLLLGVESLADAPLSEFVKTARELFE